LRTTLRFDLDYWSATVIKLGVAFVAQLCSAWIAKSLIERLSELVPLVIQRAVYVGECTVQKNDGTDFRLSILRKRTARVQAQ
jgi:hypothetical protein